MHRLHSTAPTSSAPPASPFPLPLPPLKHLRTTTPRHIRVTPRGRPTGCDTGVPRRGGGSISALYGTHSPHRGTPVSQPTGRPLGVTRMCHGVVVRISSQDPPHKAARIPKPHRHCHPSYSPPAPPHNPMLMISLARPMSNIGAAILGYRPRRGVNTCCIYEPRPRDTSVSHPAGGPRNVTRVFRGVGEWSNFCILWNHRPRRGHPF